MDENGGQVIEAYDYSDVLAHLATVKDMKPIQIDIPQEAKTTRPLLTIRVSQKIQPADGSFKKLMGVITDATEQYPDSCSIYNFKGVPIGKVDKAAGTLTVFPLELDDYKATLTQVKEKFGGNVIDKAGGKTEIVFRSGDSVAFTSDVSIDHFEIFSLVMVGISVTRYCLPIEKQTKAYGEQGITMKIKQLQVLETTTDKQVLDTFMRHPKYFNLPLPTPSELFENNSYHHVRIVDEKKRPRVLSSEMVFIPVLPSHEDALTLFGPHPGVLTDIQWAENAFAFERRKDKAMCRRATGNLMMRQYLSIADIRRWMQTGSVFDFNAVYKCSFTLWDPPLAATKVAGIDTWKAFAELFFSSIPMVMMANVDLYKTAENPLNQLESKIHPNEHFLELHPNKVLLDFVGFLQSRALPVSHKAVLNWIVKNDPRLASYTTPPVDPNNKTAVRTPALVTSNQLAANDNSYLLLNEWDNTGRTDFIKSAAAAGEYDFYAVLSTKLSDAVLKRVEIVKAFAKQVGAGYDGPLCEPMLWKDWDTQGKEAAYAKYSGQTIPPQHPLVLNPINSIVAPGQLMIVYAVHREQRKQTEAAASSDKLLLGGFSGTKRSQAHLAVMPATVNRNEEAELDAAAAAIDIDAAVAAAKTDSVLVNIGPPHPGFSMSVVGPDEDEVRAKKMRTGDDDSDL